MKKAFHDKLEVKLDEKGRPLAFSVRIGTARRAYTYAHWRYLVNYKVVDILSWWREPGSWWEGEPVTLYLRLHAVPVVKKGGGPMFCEESRLDRAQWQSLRDEKGIASLHSQRQQERGDCFVRLRRTRKDSYPQGFLRFIAQAGNGISTGCWDEHIGDLKILRLQIRRFHAPIFEFSN